MFGSGTDDGEMPVTFTVPFANVAEIGNRVESSNTTFDKLIGTSPEESAWKDTVASVPFPLAPGINPIRLSAMNDTVPAVLSMEPDSKTVVPALARNVPSETLEIATAPGVKRTSNWKAYKSVLF